MLLVRAGTFPKASELRLTVSAGELEAAAAVAIAVIELAAMMTASAVAGTPTLPFCLICLPPLGASSPPGRPALPWRGCGPIETVSPDFASSAPYGF